jgi:dTDP-4-amino-4,6-dideoxygalactose transaminase
VKALELHRWHGQTKTADGVDTVFAGGKANLSDVAARVGLGQLRRLEEFNAKRRLLVDRYFALWSDNPLVRLPERGDAKGREGHSWHIFAPLLPLERMNMSRAEFIKAMSERGIGVGVHYQAIHLFSAYKALGYSEGQFPNAEAIGKRTVTLPLFPAMELTDVDRVVAAVNEIVAGASR